MQIQFLGATETVTGSRYLVRTKRANTLVDCDLFQGYRQLRLRYWGPFPIAPGVLDNVVLTYAHLDHSGFLPALTRDGFRGKVICSEATDDLCKILLADGAHLLEEEAEYANRHGLSKHHPAAPLYTQADAERALKQFVPVAFERQLDLGDGLQATLRRTGHILGAASVTLTDSTTRTTFSGDLGRPNDLIMEPPEPVTDTDHLIIESTYGNRLHDGMDPMQKLANIIRETASLGGVTIIPAFAVGRAQIILYMLHQLKQDKCIPATLPVYLNSPMAVDATEIYQRHMADHRLSPATCRAMYQSVHVVNSAEEPIALNRQQLPMVIVAASGMATGGRVLHHLKAFGPGSRNTVLFAGYQAGGTRGAAMVAGASSVKIHGEYVPLRARVEQLENLSAHADQVEIMSWLSHFNAPPKQTFITHGEPDAADALRLHIEEKLHWPCTVPDYLQQIDLT